MTDALAEGSRVPSVAHLLVARVWDPAVTLSLVHLGLALHV